VVGGNAPVSIDLAPFKTLIRTCAGLMFEEEKRQLLESALAERMAVCALSDAERYLQRLQQDAEEMAHLLDLLTINETYFFREPDQLQLLARLRCPGAGRGPGNGGVAAYRHHGCGRRSAEPAEGP
jgi:chemotaxis protein methyltransferase CheR